uniref:Ig-like domain-containing protein n=1 Tax=Cyprinus carpio TaxID=7962 RepID=A0A8C2HVD0_CYPCA
NIILNVFTYLIHAYYFTINDLCFLIGFTVRGPSGPLVAPLGSSVVLPCYVDELLLMEGLEVEWRRTDSETLVHLYQNGESRAESQEEVYHGRVQFFTDQIQHGNFSLRLDNLTAEDEGVYRCTFHSQQDSGEIVVQIKHERLLVSGSSRSISASVGEDVTLNCSVDSHITPEHIEVSWLRTDGDILVLFFQNNQTLPDSSEEQYRDRDEFFTAEIPKGNSSLRLKSVRTEDKGDYMCQVFAGGLSANATADLERLGFSSQHIAVLFFCSAAGSGAVLLLFSLIYYRSNDTCFVNLTVIILHLLSSHQQQNQETSAFSGLLSNHLYAFGLHPLGLY